MVDLEEVVDDDVELLQRPKENRLVTTLTSNKATVGIELIKLVLLFVICVVAGLLLVARSRNAPPTVPPVPAENGEVVPPVPSQPAGASPQPPAATANATDWEYKIVLWDTTYVEDCQATTEEWESFSLMGSSSVGAYTNTACFCGDSPCYAGLGPDVIDPNMSADSDYQKVRRFGLVPDPGTTCNTCGPQSGGWEGFGSAESKSSFVNTAMKEGLTRDELFTQCGYPTTSRTIKFFSFQDSGYSTQVQWYDLTDEQYGASHYGFTPIEITVGVSLEVVEAEAVSCVLEKLVNRIAEDGWEFTDGGIDYQNFRRPRTR
mmetsp:Transcript_11235/g.47923  ORF Transcript_11235/g.47923 Transcript_11235/m.47923 type:complete len:318 (+) Transcript_11235:221-1174(+)